MSEKWRTVVGATLVVVVVVGTGADDDVPAAELVLTTGAVHQGQLPGVNPEGGVQLGVEGVHLW